MARVRVCPECRQPLRDCLCPDDDGPFVASDTTWLRGMLRDCLCPDDDGPDDGPDESGSDREDPR